MSIKGKNKKIIILERKASTGDIGALISLAWEYDKKHLYRKAYLTYASIILKTENPIVFYNFSLCYLWGRGVKKNLKRAFLWSKKAASYGDIDALVAVGWSYLNGAGVKKDVEKAQYYYEMALDKSPEDASALFTLGEIAYDKSDYGRAYAYYYKAYVDEDHMKSGYRLGRMLMEGKGCTQNIASAEEILKYVSRRKIYRAKRLLQSKYWRRIVAKKK